MPEKLISKPQQPNENNGILVQGHIKIFDPNTKEVLVDKRNAIHYENFSESLIGRDFYMDFSIKK